MARESSSAGFVPLIRMAILCGFMVTLVLGGHMALKGTLEIGLYSVLVFMTQRLLWPMTELGETLDLYQRGCASIRRILDLIDAPIAIVPGRAELPPLAAGAVPARAVRFEDVEFPYGNGTVPVLRGLSLDVGAGETHTRSTSCRPAASRRPARTTSSSPPAGCTRRSGPSRPASSRRRSRRPVWRIALARGRRRGSPFGE